MPDGVSWRLCYGVLNLTQRDSHDMPKPLVPGKAVDVDIPLGFVAQQLRAGERLRIAISEGLWPLVWPSPEGPTLTLDPTGSGLTLPVRMPPPVEPAMPIKTVSIPPDKGAVVVTTVNDHGHVTMTGSWPDTSSTCANGTILSGYGPNTIATIDAGAPNSGRWSGNHVSRYRRADWNCELHTAFEIRSTATTFDVTESISAFRDGVSIFERTARNSVPRHLI